jgi:hypothetical protein
VGASLKGGPEGFPGIGAGVNSDTHLNFIPHIAITQFTVLLQD